MSEWFINDEIRYLHRVIQGAMCGSISSTPVSGRLFKLGIISLFNHINKDLSQLNDDLDVSIKLEGVSIDFDTYLDDKYWESHLFYDEAKIYNDVGISLYNHSFSSEINQMTDYLPINEKDYNFPDSLLDSFKKSLNQLCDVNNIGTREIQFALHFGFFFMMRLLSDIKKKVEHPKPHQFKNVWNEIYDDSDVKCDVEYVEWKEYNEDFTLADLKNKQTYAIYKLLDSGFFRFYDSITGGEINKRNLIITNDDLPHGINISDNLPAECAKFEKFIEWKGGHIVSMNYEKLGQYIYKNYRKFEYIDTENIVRLDKTLDAIHEDMAHLKPELEKYLKGYEEKKVNDLINECADILLTCQKYLATNLKPSIFKEYLEKLLFDKDSKEEARKKLSGSSKKTYICHIIAAMKNVGIIAIGSTKQELASSLHGKLDDILVSTLEKNIERAYNATKGPLYEWTKKHADEIIKNNMNPFAGIPHFYY